MKQLQGVKKKLPLLLLMGIITLCVVFIFINCGLGPQGKINNPNAGQYAIDFSDTTGNSSALYVISSVFLKRQGSEVTLEAWVKRKNSVISGIVISRHQEEGALLWVNNDEPKFALRRISGPTSTNYTVDSGVSLSANTWHHIAGVLTNAVVSHPSSTSCTPAVMAETPHLEIYVDGVFKNCATTGSQSMPDLSTCPDDPITGEPQYGTGNCAGDTLGVGVAVGPLPSDGTDVKFDGVIDEVRYWTTARTQKEINACMDQELVSNNSGDCGINNSDLGAYLRFNEGKGSSTGEYTGLGSGNKESPFTFEWDGGWVSGAPITRED